MAISAADRVGLCLSSFTYTQRAPEKAMYRPIGYKVVHYGRSRLFKVSEIGTSRKPIYATISLPFQLYAYLPSFPRGLAITILYVENLRFFAAFTHLRLV